MYVTLGTVFTNEVVLSAVIEAVRELAALGAGLPQLCLPQAADQFLNAAASARAGVGLTIDPGEVSVGRVREAIDRLLSVTEFQTAAQRGSDEIAALPSADSVAERLHRDYG